MTEPFYVRQIVASSREEAGAFWRSCRNEADAQGATFARACVYDPSAEKTPLLYEAWKERPESEGEPRWMLADAQPERGA